ncbi:MAG: helix-turn-helix domain-containing protein [Rickettsiaceae bacterium]|nr:helix-turn-helix domain-containing protein [Rickettsiaceae bacterium]MDP4832419.1 helix-turn-helix domain-containing protein [Rickettsiaceae bacterium]MDP5020148.1 helix-turn-helix domain-containing protein [Rickettsiaceae bacterium]MDP5082754.1 helix-turn-helix domain-containing protein [Rickettsiaceae bacterium]
MTSKLKEAREAAGYSIEELSKILKIRKQYLTDLEEEVYDNIPGQVYIDGYTKIYYEFLGLDCPTKNNITINVPKLAKIENQIEKKYIILLSAVLLVAVISFYLYFKSTVSNEIVPLDDGIPLNDIATNVIEERGNNEDIIEEHGNNEATID